MSLSQLFQRKLRLEMRLLHIVEKRPSRQIKLTPLDAQDFIISLQSVSEWSRDNLQLYSQLLQNGMAEFICNQQYLYDFYKHLSFPGKSLETIDANSLRFHNLTVLDLSRNNIKIIENVPPNCREIYLDFNFIDRIEGNHTNSLELLSLSHNLVDDATVGSIVQVCPHLRCLNIGWNAVTDLKNLVPTLHKLEKLKVLVTAGNPISMLAIYRTYLTEHLQLAHFDGEKYVKPEPPKPVQEPKQEKKEEKKEDKKDSKKDTKKGGKVEEKPVQEVKVEPPKVEVKKELTQEDFETVKITVKIGNLEQFAGNAYETSLFPADTDLKKTQTNYWLKYQLLGQWVELKQKTISFDNTTVEGDEVRLNLQATLHRSIKVDKNSLSQFNEGMRVQIHQVEPKMIKDPQTFQLKPEITGGELQTVSSILGAIHVDFRGLHTAHKKELKQKYRLFKAEAVSSPLFSDPYENEDELIGQLKGEFEAKLRKIEEQRIKKAQEQELLKQQKKGGKDQKKPPQKKATKKEGKDAPVADKKKAQKCDYPTQKREYCVLDGNRIFKGKELLCIHVAIQ